MTIWEAKEALIEIGRRLWQRGFVAGNDGNLSVRLDGETETSGRASRLLTTASGVSKGFMTPEMLVVTDLDGRVISGERRPSSELKMHLEVYRLRHEVRAVVHAHPPMATAFSVAGVALDRCVLPESVLTMGAIPIAPYATPSTEEIPESIRAFIPDCDAILLSNHGAVTWAETLEQAWFKMEQLEMTATILHHAMTLGNVNALSASAVEKLRQVRERLGLAGRVLPCEAAGGCLRPGGRLSQHELPRLVETIVAAVVDVLVAGEEKP